MAEPPPNTQKDLSQVNADLYTAVSQWLKKHGKGVKPKLSDEQRQQLKECFELMDQDGSGAIDAEELGAAFKLLGIRMKRAELAALLAEVDHDGSGEVEYPEFLEIMTVTLQRLADEEDSQKNEGQVPFALMATAYRRKRLMEGIINGDKEVQAQIQQISEKANLEALQQTKAAEVEALRIKAAGGEGSGGGGFGSRGLRGSSVGSAGAPRSPSGRPLRRIGQVDMVGKQLLENMSPDERKIINSLANRANHNGARAPPPPPGALLGSARLYGSYSQSPTHRQLLDTPQLLDLRFVHQSTIRLPPGAGPLARTMPGGPGVSTGGTGAGSGSAARRSSSATRGTSYGGDAQAGHGMGGAVVAGVMLSPGRAGRAGGDQLPALRYEGGGVSYPATKQPLGKMLGTHGTVPERLR